MKHIRSLFVGVLPLTLVAFAAAQDITTTLQPGRGVTFKSADGNATVNLGGRIQVRHTYEENADSSTFNVPRLRLSLKGTLQGNWNWEFQSDFAKHEKTSLKDGFIERAFAPALAVRGGQFKVAFDRQQLESSGRQTFADRNIVSSSLGKGRDVGVQAHGAFLNKIVQYQVGVFNGGGEGAPNADPGHLWAARVSFNPLGDFGLSQGDIKPSTSPRVFLDLAAYRDQDDGGTAEGTTGVAVAAGAKMAGAYGAAEYIRRETSAGVTAQGFYGQAGYMLIAERLEAAARYAQLDPNADVDDDLRTEATAGVNVFFANAGHALKLTADVSWLTDEARVGDERNNTRTRLQAQLNF